MTISLERTEAIASDGIEMAEPTENQRRLDELFEWLETAPEGYRIEIVGGEIFMSPQRNVHWQTIRQILRALEDRFGMDVLVTSDVRVDFPGQENGFCPDVAKFADGAKEDGEGRWHYQDIEFIAEVVSKGTAPNDYGPKKAIYAEAEIPVYVIADPYAGRCRVFTDPQDGDYKGDITVPYGDPIDLTATVVGLTISTAEFPRD
ncbi:Uma2 family endonuclease [Streptomyces sp. NPDC050355]|uniref:Uma2 family endonuclease n=1 Tax=Streptomyces sp. NPDC050355 TaxID=3365609 RepID=UPI0037A50D15